MSTHSINSDDYKHLKFIDQESINHPSIDKDLDSSFSSSYSHIQPSQVKSEIVNRLDSEDNKAKSFFSEPVFTKQYVVSLTEEELARHNNNVPPLSILSYQEDVREEEDYEFAFDEREFLKRLDERCNDIQRDIDEKFKRLEEQLTKTEEELHQSKCDIEELSFIEKEYINQGIQTDLGNHDIQKLNEIENAMTKLSLDPSQITEKVPKWKADSEKLKDAEQLIESTRKIVWDQPFVPLDRICRQLPTAVNLDGIEEDEDICDFHREKYLKAVKKSMQDKELYQHHPSATINRLSKIVQYRNN